MEITSCVQAAPRRNGSRAVSIAAMALLLLFWLFVGANVSYAHDDWDWGLPAGVEQWLTGYFNNRFVGNFFVIIMTRSALVKALVMGGGMFAVPLLLALLAAGGARERFLPLYLAANALTLLTPVEVWQQTYGWVSGFANYGVSATALLGWLLLLRHLLRPEGARHPLALGGVLLPYTVALCLFVENLTVLVLLAALVLLGYALAAHRGRLALVLVLVGAAAGFFFMFSNRIYAELGSSGTTMGGLRTLSFEPGSPLPEVLLAILERYFVYLLPELTMENPVCLLLLTAISACWLGRSRWPALALLALFPGTCTALCAFFPGVFSETGRWVCCLLCWALALLAAPLCRGAVPRRLERTGLVLLTLGALAPFAVSLDSGGRLYSLLYVLLSLLFLDAAEPLLTTRPGIAFSAAGLAVLLVLWGHVYWQIGQCNALREQIVIEALENGDEIAVLPTESYEVWWGRNPTPGWRSVRYRDFFGIPHELSLIFLPVGSFEHWPEITQADWDNALYYGYAFD